MSNYSSKEAGFSLLEVLVAFAILSLTLGIILQIISLSGTISYQSGLTQKALVVAENKMSELLAQKLLEPGHEERQLTDQHQSLRWATDINEIEFPDQLESASSLTLIPYQISVSVSQADAETPLITLTSIRLVRLR